MNNNNNDNNNDINDNSNNNNNINKFKTPISHLLTTPESNRLFKVTKKN